MTFEAEKVKALIAAIKQVQDHPLIRYCLRDAARTTPLPGSLWIDWQRCFDALKELEQP